MRHTSRTLLVVLSVVAILLCLSAPAEAVVAHVQTCKSSDNTAGTTVTSCALTFTAGTLALCGVIQFNAVGITSATLSGGGSFVVDKTLSDGSFRASLMSLPNVAGGSQTCNITFASSSDFTTVFLMEVSGAATSAPQDGTGDSATGSDTAVTTGSFTGVATSFYAAVMFMNLDPTTITAGSGWTIPTNGSELDGVNNTTGAIEYKANPGGTSHDGQFTIDPSSSWIVVAHPYLVAAAGGSTGSHGLLLRVGP